MEENGSTDRNSYIHSFILGAKYFCHIWGKLKDKYLLFSSQQNHHYVACSIATDKPVISLIVIIFNPVNAIKVCSNEEILNLKE